MRELINQLKAQGSSNSFQARMKHSINRAFIYGMESGLVRGMHQSPTFGVQVDKREERKPEILNLGQIRKLLEQAKAIDHKWFPVWAMALLTGMRSGELYALLWSDVNW